jgi:fructose-1,6-bisphosphatase/sedoheptulose 1,7-bisphosphatase-like protein
MKIILLNNLDCACNTIISGGEQAHADVLYVGDTLFDDVREMGDLIVE